MSVVSKEASQLHSDHPDILKAQDCAYGKVAKRGGYDPAEVYRMSQKCAIVATAICVSLRGDGYDFWPVARRVVDLLYPESRHVYGRSSETPRGLIVVDGAWQQFLPYDKKDPDLPPVLVGTHDEVTAFIENAGVPSYLLEHWQAVTPDRYIVEADERLAIV